MRQLPTTTLHVMPDTDQKELVQLIIWEFSVKHFAPKPTTLL